MTLPAISNETEALQLVELVSSDERIRALIELFTADRELTRIALFLREKIEELDASERDHAAAIAKAWEGRLGIASVTDLSGLDLLKQLAAAWDFRLGRERDAIPVSDEILPPDVVELVNAISSDWGMRDQVSVSGNFDVIAPIGGLVRANIARPATAAALLEDGAVTTDYVVGLAGLRQTTDTERKLSIEMGVPANSEQDALRFGLEQAFKLDPNAWSVLNGHETLWVNQTGNVPVLLGGAPVDSATGNRATTGQALKWLLGVFHLPADSSILQITTSIYWIANQIALRTSTPRAMKVMTVGQRGNLHNGPVQMFRSQHYLQEIKAVIDYLPKLHEWATTVD